MNEENRGFDKDFERGRKNEFYVVLYGDFSEVENCGFMDLQKKVKTDQFIENKGKQVCGNLCGKCE